MRWTVDSGEDIMGEFGEISEVVLMWWKFLRRHCCGGYKVWKKNCEKNLWASSRKYMNSLEQIKYML